jgi:hypothetical protein
MIDQDPQIAQLSDSLVDEIVGAVGLPKTGGNHRLFKFLFRNVTDALSKIGVPFDRKIAESGLPEAARWCLLHFCDNVESTGTERVPPSGPLLVVSNHPGSYDALVIFSLINRKDLNWISSEIPFLDQLRNTREHIFFASRKETSSRMLALKNSIRHLQNGGTLLYFGAGHRDPDPAVFPGAEAAMSDWLDVFDTFNKYVEKLQFLPVVVSGVVTEKWASHPITRLRRKQIDKHRLAEFGQVITQLILPGKLMVAPAASIGVPFCKEDLQLEGTPNDLRAVMIERGKALLREHVDRFDRKFI